jgi:hypothetical protein
MKIIPPIPTEKNKVFFWNDVDSGVPETNSEVLFKPKQTGFVTHGIFDGQYFIDYNTGKKYDALTEGWAWKYIDWVDRKYNVDNG